MASNLTPQLAKHAQQQCPLFTLPPELRNQIYRMAFECPLDSIDLVRVLDQFRLSYGSAEQYHEHSLYLQDAAPPSSALLRSCQAIRSESAGLFKDASQAFDAIQHVMNVKSLNYVDRLLTERTFPSASDCYLERLRCVTFSIDRGQASVKITLKRLGTDWDASFTKKSCGHGNGHHEKLDRHCERVCALFTGNLDWSPQYLRSLSVKQRLFRYYRAMDNLFDLR